MKTKRPFVLAPSPDTRILPKNYDICYQNRWREMDQYSYIAHVHPNYIDSLYKEYKENPSNIDSEWQKFFEGFDFAVSEVSANGEATFSPKEFKVYNLIQAYRAKGHLISDTNPIKERKDRHANLDLQNLGLSEDDLDTKFYAGEELGLGQAPLRDIVQHLKNIYAGQLGFEYDYLIKPEVKSWFRDKVENESVNHKFSLDQKQRILQKLNETVVLEQFLNKKYIGQKRFSLEGGESTVPALDTIINDSAEYGTQEVVIGMAHRGRLNVLANIMGKTYENIFSEFEGNVDPDLTRGDGDVKYHLGFSSQVTTPSDKTVNLKLTPNPSHLEAVDPVVEGFTRAKADLLYEENFDQILPILIHGDAALPGQGVVYEVLQMSQLNGYHTGGTIHFVINNQLGFTTSFEDARSSNYSTSVASTVQAPVIHVNGDDVESVVYAVKVAAEFRAKFHRDIFIDMVCYRKHGHNEGDDPKFTQPKMYKKIEQQPNPREIYINKLVEGGHIEREMAKNMDKSFWQSLQERLEQVKEEPLHYDYQEPELAWKQLRKSTSEDFKESPDTTLSKELFDEVFEGMMSYKSDLKILRKVDKLFKQKRKQKENNAMDWSIGELAAYGSLLLEGYDVRLSGQDTKRGTFSHRHAVLYDEDTNQDYDRLSHYKNQKGSFRIYNSPLSELGALGFEYGYSLASPNTLTLWEAQFGDFCNGAQTVIDEFIVSAESKWDRMSGLVMLLPHGYEGQGPDHSSARLERFLQLCAEFNIIVANCTTPANFFHLLRRQLKWPFRKPLVHMSPKSLLRHPQCVSPIEDFTERGFHELIDDPWITAPSKVKRVLLCSGKIYYDLLKNQQDDNRKDVAIVRLEQLFPLPYQQMDNIVKRYKNAAFYWVQEEPANMGAWVYLLSCYQNLDWKLVARKASASPASGFMNVHQREQDRLVKQAFE
jgi:2-oxoglutarate dehydrogenase E1 component